VNRIRSRKIKYSTTCLVSVLRAFAILAAAAQQDVVLLGPNGALGSEGNTAPGGSHVELWVEQEGYAVAQRLSERGIAGFALKYRLPHEAGSSDTVEGDSVPEMQRGIPLVRSRAEERGLDPARVGVMGFSAGGGVAARAATQFDAGTASTSDPIDRQSSKPSFRRSFIRDCRRICQFGGVSRRRSCGAAKTIDREFPQGFLQFSSS
jgi:hypothetical protein